MTTAQYLLGRKKYSRPQAMLWANSQGTIQEDPNNPGSLYYVPEGYESGTDKTDLFGSNQLDQFIILSDDNRGPIDFSVQRIEKRERMINGRMRSYHTADKLSITTSWTMIPSRSFATYANFNPETGKSTSDGAFGKPNSADGQFTTDGGAGGVEMLKWYEDHTGPFWVYLAYDKYTSFGTFQNAYEQLPKYNQIIQMYIADFSYSVQKRGGSNYDFWNISVTLEEV